jgi:hypothetical protein
MLCSLLCFFAFFGVAAVAKLLLPEKKHTEFVRIACKRGVVAELLLNTAWVAIPAPMNGFALCGPEFCAAVPHPLCSPLQFQPVMPTAAFFSLSALV